MAGEIKIRWGWLKFMYIYTIVGSGGIGVGMIFAPQLFKSMLGWPIDEPIAVGILGSVYMAFGILAIFGFRSPLKFVPILFMQLLYKAIWFVGVLLPLLITGRFPTSLYAIFIAVAFATYIIGDLIAIPFAYLFGEQQGN